MATKTLYFNLNSSEEGFIPRFLRKKEETYDSSDIALLRKVLSKERGKILYFLKNEKISSIYHLTKLLKRDFKSVYQDLKLLEKIGFIEFVAEKKGKKEKYIPKLLYDKIELVLYL